MTIWLAIMVEDGNSISDGEILANGNSREAVMKQMIDYYYELQIQATYEDTAKWFENITEEFIKNLNNDKDAIRYDSFSTIYIKEFKQQ